VTTRVDRDTLFGIALLVALLLGVAASLLWPVRETGTNAEPLLPITCFSDEQCGGRVELERFCDLGKLYAYGQRNTCVQPGTAGNSCLTEYGPWLVAESCIEGTPLENVENTERTTEDVDETVLLSEPENT